MYKIVTTYKTGRIDIIHFYDYDFAMQRVQAHKQRVNCTSCRLFLTNGKTEIEILL